MTCPTCSTTFVPRRADQRHCELRCTRLSAKRAYRARHRTEAEERPCKRCAAPFLPSAARRLYCDGCREAARRELQTRRRLRRSSIPSERRRCARSACGKPFETRNRRRFFCSDHCAQVCGHRALREFRKPPPGPLTPPHNPLVSSAVEVTRRTKT